MDAITLLKADHDKVKKLLAELESTSESFYPVDLPSLLRDLTT